MASRNRDGRSQVIGDSGSEKLQDEHFWETVYPFLLDRMDEGIHVIDSHGITRVYNRKMAELEAMDPVDVLGRKVLDVVRFAQDEDSTLMRALHTGRETMDMRQTYFNNQGRAITTMNDTFPIVIDGQVIGAVEIAHDVTQMEQALQSRIQAPPQFTFDTIIGADKNLLEVLNHARRTARTMSSVLIVGETGTGKELVAQSIHQAGSRANGPFVSQNCAALPESLIEGLLFGTVRGAFTGAIDRPGLIEQAKGGTLLLDELNALSPLLQAKLLRVLQERTVRRVGGTEEVHVDTRMIATINEDPVEAIAANRLRKDLYYRLGVVTLFLPPLRERSGDIPVLTSYFIDKYNQLFQLHVTGIEEELMRKFMTYSWPGNVRELEHAIEGAMNLMDHQGRIHERDLAYHMRARFANHLVTKPALSDNSDVQRPSIDVQRRHHIEDLSGRTGLVPPDLTSDLPSGQQTRSLHTRLSDYEKVCITDVLLRCGGNISKAARELGVSRQSLQYRMRKLNLRTSPPDSL